MDLLLARYASMAVAPNVLAALIGIPSALLYLMEVCILLAFANQQQQFRSSFFHLFIVRALPSIFNMFASYLGLRFGLLGLFFPLYQGMPPWLLNFLFFSSYYTYHVENLSTTVLLLNRFMSIAFALSYDKVWRKWQIVADLAIFGLPLIITWPIFGTEMEAQYFDHTNTSFGILNLERQFPCSQFVAHSGATFLIICSLLNFASWLAYRKKYSNVKVNTGQQAEEKMATGLSKIEWNLFIYALCTVICQLIMTGIYYGIYLSTSHYAQYGSRMGALFMDLLFNNYGLVNDICTIAVPAWLMLFSCAKMREILKMQMRLLWEWMTHTFRAVPSNRRPGSIFQNGACSRVDGRLYCQNNFVEKI